MRLTIQHAALTAALAWGVTAQAAPFRIDSTSIAGAGGALAGVPGAVSNNKFEFGLSYNSSTVITDANGDGIGAGDVIETTGGFGVAPPAGFAGGVAENIFTAVAPSNTPAQNGYFGNQWGITFDVTQALTGVVESVSAIGSPQLKYESGVISLYLYGLSDPQLDVPGSTDVVKHHFMDVQVRDSFNDGDSHYLVGNVDFASVADTAYSNVLNSVDASCGGSHGFYSIWSGCNESMSILFQIDYNTDVTVSDFALVGPNQYAIRSRHDGSVTFDVNVGQVTEPATLALAGLGLLGLVLVNRGRRR